VWYYECEKIQFGQWPIYIFWGEKMGTASPAMPMTKSIRDQVFAIIAAVQSAAAAVTIHSGPVPLV
jgi:hypothetical protein